ncbi:MAG: IS66 family insertion sequence element accessory protein TnpB [Bdellovibrionales bacterium]|nr:IS66 family insertion sequence element accessory protein TnpB [Bdellovibrionales bacterium]
MIYVPEVKRILFYSEPVDMRKSFNGLTGVTRQLLDENPLSGDMFVFSNRKGNYVKILFWDRTGFCIYAKRLERGRFKIFGSKRVNEITQEQLTLLLDGIALGRKRRVR